MDNPFDQFDAAPPAQGLGRPIIRRAPAQAKPPSPNLPVGWQLGPDGVAFYTPGLPPAKTTGPGALTSEDRGKFTRQRQGALGLRQRIGEIEQIYADAFRGAGGDVVNPATGARTQTSPGLGSAAEYLPGRTPIIGRPVNEVFKNASGALMGDLAAAYGLTAQQQNTPVELEIRFGPFIPKAGDPDEVIEKKIARLKEISAEQERQALDALGEPAAQQRNDNQAAPLPMGGGAPPSNGGDAPPGPNLAPSSDGYKDVIDPQLQKMAGRIGKMIAQGADFKRVMGFAVGVNPDLRDDPAFRASVQKAISARRDPQYQAYFRQTGNYPVDPGLYTRKVPMSGGEQFRNDAAQTAPGAYAMRAGNMLSMNTLDNMTSDPAQARQSLDVAGQMHPLASLAGDVSGGTLAALTGEGALARLGMNPGVGRALLADTGFGAGVGAGGADNGDRLSGAAMGGAFGLGGSLVGQGGANMIGRAAQGVTSPAVGYVAREKVPLTIGQALGDSGRVGSFIKSAEDRLSGIGLDAGMINARRAEGVDKMNARAFDKALEPIGKTVKGMTGEQAVAQAQDYVSDAFNDALAGKAATADRPFITQAASAKRAIQNLPRLGGEVESSVDELIGEYFDPTTLSISGENMQALLRGLEDIKRSYKNDPLGHRVGKSIEMVSQSIEGLFRRQAPDVMPKYDIAKQAFKRLSTVEDAVLRGKNTGGKFTPAQLGQADRANTVRYGGKHKAAAGKGEFHDFQRNMQDVLPSKVPDSGTAGRIALPLAMVGGGAGLGAAAGDPTTGGKAGLTLAGLLALTYSRAGQRALVASVAKRGPAAQAVGKSIRARSRLIGAGGAALASQGTTGGQ